MKKAALVGLAGVLLAAIGWPQPGGAQGVPPGSYLSTCGNVDLRGNTLAATCRRAGGGQLRTALVGVSQCAGDIGNNNGVLQCALPGGGQLRGQVVQPRQRDVDRPPGYGPPPPPYNGRDEYRESRRERCRELHQRAEDLRARRDWAWYPDERERFERRLRRVEHEQRELRCRY